MSGLTMRIIPRSIYAFSNITTSGTANILIASHIDASPFQQADLMVRFHGGTVLPAGSNIVVGFMLDGYDFSDPAPVNSSGGPGPGFLSAFPAAVGAGNVQLLSTSGLPFYGVASWSQGSPTSTPFGRLLAIGMTVTMGATAGSVAAFLSVDLSLKGGDPRSMAMMPNGYRGYRIM